jgi:hypothetical protein
MNKLMVTSLGAALALGCAAASASSASGTVTNVQFSVVDLTPGDGVASTFSAYNYYTQAQYGGFSAVQDGLDFGISGGPYEHAFSLSGHGQLDGSSVDAAATADPGYYETANVFVKGKFTLSAHSGLLLSFNAWASVQADPVNYDSVTYAGAMLQDDLGGEQDAALIAYAGQTLSSPLSVYIENTGATETTGTFKYYVSANVQPVPEPATAAMLLAGLGLMASVARRRKG